MMGIINGALNGLFNVLFLPFQSLGSWTGMIVISLLTSFLMLYVFRFTSNQAGILREKNLIKAHLLELRLFKDNMAVQFRSQGKILLANLRYVGHNARPMLVMIVPIMLVLVQLNLRYGSESLKPGEPALLKVKLAKGYLAIETAAALESSDEVEIETPPLRIEDEGEIDWRIRGRRNGIGRLTLAIGTERFEKAVVVGAKAPARISPIRVGRGIIDRILNPGEPPLPKGSPVESVEVRYAAARMDFFGARIHWLVVYFVLSIVFGFAFKGVFKVEI
jgi:hypothetical protein